MSPNSIGYHGRWATGRSESRVLPVAQVLLCDGDGLRDCTPRGLSALLTAAASTTDGLGHCTLPTDRPALRIMATSSMSHACCSVCQASYGGEPTAKPIK